MSATLHRASSQRWVAPAAASAPPLPDLGTITGAMMSTNPWFPFFPSDYRGDTAHLRFVEDSAYRRLLDHYYLIGGPIPASFESLYRITGAQDLEEKKAVGKVANEFFKREGDVLRNKRADEEIARRREFIEAQKARARKRWGDAGAYAPAMPGHMPEGSGGSAVAMPSTSTSTTTSTSKEKNTVALARDVLAFLNEKAGRNYQPVKVNLDMIVARLKEGATVTELRQVIAKKTREWKGDEKMAMFLRPATLFNRTKFAQYQGELTKTGSN